MCKADATVREISKETDAILNDVPASVLERGYVL